MNNSIKKLSKILKQEGTSRQERYMPALHETADLMDNRKLQDMILYMQQYSKNLLFIPTDGSDITHKESWDYFFSNDPVLLIASIASVNVQKIKDEYDRLNKIFQNNPGIRNFSVLTKYVLSRFIGIDTWYIKSSKDSLLFQDLQLYIPSYLQKELEKLREMMLYCFDHLDDDAGADEKATIRDRNEKTLQELENMDPIWELNQKEKPALRERIFKGNNETEKLINASVTLNKIFEVVFYTTDSITEKSGRYFDETIHDKQDHNPHVALIITFIQLFGYVQKELNKIPQRLLNFYYRDVLKIKEKAPVPDHAYVVFELVKGFETCLLKKGTRLSAGKDKLNHELVYATDKDVVLNQAKVTALRTALIDRNTTGEILNYYSDIITDTPGQVKPAEQSVAKPALMFVDPNEKLVAEIGFAIASSQFYLAKGERNVIITLYASSDIEPDEVIKNNEGINEFETGIIRLLFSGEKGWINSDDIDSGITIHSFKKIGNAAVELDFTISIAQEQAIVPFNNKLHDGNFNTSFPVMKCILKFPGGKNESGSEKKLYQLNTLQKLQITGANISIQVGTVQSTVSFDGVRDLILENDESLLDNKKPFYPFTPVPKVSSSFYIGCKDLFYKKIQTLSINIEWLLPDNFRSHYQKYNPPYDSNKFRATLSYLEKNRWKKYSEISVIDINSGNPRFRMIKMNLEKQRTGNTPEDADIPEFDSLKKNGTIKLKLHYPDFGHSIYPQLITSTVMEKSKAGNVDFYKLVKKKLHDDIFTIELPPDLNKKNGPLKVVYDILDNVHDDSQARNMLINALSDIISRNNDVLMVTKRTDLSAMATGEIPDEKGSEVVVRDQNFIEKVLRIFRKLNIVDEDIHHDRDKEGVENVVENLEDEIYEVADFILPSKQEMNMLIINEVNKSINQTVANAVGIILELRAETKTADAERISQILNDEFDKARKVINDMIAKKIALSLSANEIPPPPYSPLINSISVNYSSSKDMSRNDNDKIFHLTLAGSSAETDIWQGDKILTETEEATLIRSDHIFPQPLKTRMQGKDVTMSGMLFIGIADILPDQNLSLFFQIVEGTKINDQAPPPVYWFYMRHNEWEPLNKDNIISDSTHELQTTGIIEFSIPGDADNVNTFFNTTNQYWLCAGVPSNAGFFPLLTDVKSQAVRVTFINHQQNPRHMALAMEAGKIKKLVDDVPEVKKVTQPAPSFNGKIGEEENEYFIRVSERLRHKSRAINNRDYETLVLDAFPGIFKVKCLNNYFNGHFAAGHVTIVPIADLRNNNNEASNLLIPRINYIELKKIEIFLRERTSPFVKIHAINPKLEHVLVKCKVKFYSGVDKGFYINKLNEDLVDFLTPWASDTGKISFSAKIYASTIINFIDERPYVDYVMDMVMFQYTEDKNGQKTYVFNKDKLASLVETKVTTDHSVLVSAPKHQVELVD